MRTLRALTVATSITLSLAAGCSKPIDSDHATAPAAAGEGGASAEVRAPGALAATASATGELGGQMVAVGSNFVELRLFKSGHAEALVYDAKGARVADLEKAKVTVHANAAGGARSTLVLGFAALMGRLSGEAGGKADLAPGPVEVELAINGTTASGKLESAVLLVGPEIGGTLVVAGKYGVELVAHADGSVEALVHDAAGMRVSGDAGVKIEAKLQGVDGHAHAVALAFDAKRAMFVGHAEAGLQLVAGLAEISVNGEAAARLPKLALRAEAKHGGRVIVAGDYSIELVANGAAVTAFAFDASGAASAKGDLDLSLRLGDGAFVKLVWDAPSASYTARLDAKVDLDLQPITVSVKADGKAFVGASMPSLALDGKAKLAVDAKADAKASAGLGGKATVKAPSVTATAKVEPPKVKASAGTTGGAGAGGAATAKAGFSFGTH